jgi:capping protein alpha
VNLKNFWSGKWASTWNLSTSEEVDNATLSGEVKIHVHYFEDGNLQMQSQKKVAGVSFAYNNEQVLVDKVAATIQVRKQTLITLNPRLTLIIFFFNSFQSQEAALQSGLEEMYTNMNNETFRSMRRIMPITRTKMDWNVNSVRMVRQVRK